MLMAGRGIPDDGEEWEEMTSFLNDGEEVIGAMIRGDTFGLVNPGRPELAAEMAWRDGSITHKKTGLYAEMWVAATIAAAFTTFDPVEAIKIGIEHLPKNARYTEALRQALEISLGDEDWMVAYEEINARWGHLGHAGTFNESAAIINALVHSVGKDGLVDYEKVICRTVMHGWDTDCSAATAGCIAGVLCGFHNIPDKWLAPLNNTYYTCVATDIDTQIDKLAERVYQMSRIIHP
jgi:ADP-ribosylglycohydrolase